jgi:hypothetical protein
MRPSANKKWKSPKSWCKAVGSFIGDPPLHAPAIVRKHIHEKRLRRFSWMVMTTFLASWKLFATREIYYQVNFNANWICRDDVFISVIAPAEALDCVPSGFKMTRLSFGEVKFGRFMILKNSARN